MTELKPKSNTIQETLLALDNCTRLGARFVRRSGEATFYPYSEVIARAKSVAGALQASGLEPGDRVAIILPTSIEFFDVFLGTQLAGGIPAALYPPFFLGKLNDYFARTRKMLSRIGARFLVTEARIKAILGPASSGVESLKKVLEAKSLLTSDPWTPVAVDPETPAFLQFSSGSTSEPKAVVVSQLNLLYNLEMMDTVFQTFTEADPEKGAVCWIPLYHDMGLVGFMFNGLYHPATVTYIGPEVFIASPAVWLKTMSKYKAQASAAPHFAYGYCVARIKDEEMQGVDLSNWLLALNGAEPVEAEGMRKFTERFRKWGFRPAAMTPGYGLAEAGLAVSFSDPHSEPLVTEFDRDELSAERRAVEGKGRKLASLGHPMPGLEVAIWDERDSPLAGGAAGKIMVRGPSVSPGYFNDAETTRQTIRNGWLDTGDLGFFHGGDLYIAGRAKDLIIIRGRNYAPQEIEELAAQAAGVRPGWVVAVSQSIDEDSGEQLLVLAERDARSKIPEDEIAAEIRQKVVAGIGLTPYHVQILDPDTLPRTSSGKLRRSDALRMFLAGELAPAEKMGAFKLLREIGKSQVAWGRFWLRTRSGE